METRGGSRLRSWRKAAGGTAIALAVVAGACGGDGGLSKSEFAQKANALCEAEHVKVDKLFESFPEDATPEQMQELVSDFAPVIRDYRDGVKALGAPEDAADVYGDYTELLDEAVAKYEAASVDPVKAEALFSEEGTRLADLERKLGLDVCASR